MSDNNRGNTVSFKATGWIEREVADKFAKRIVLRVNESEEGIKFPQRMLLDLSKKCAEEYSPNVGDKIEVTAMPWRNEGVSKSSGKEHCISKIIATKVEVLESAEETTTEEGACDSDDLPF